MTTAIHGSTVPRTANTAISHREYWAVKAAMTRLTPRTAMVIAYRFFRAACWSAWLGSASVMSSGSLRSRRLGIWLEATDALPWTGRGEGGGGRLRLFRPAPEPPAPAAHRATRSCPMQVSRARLRPVRRRPGIKPASRSGYPGQEPVKTSTRGTGVSRTWGSPSPGDAVFHTPKRLLVGRPLRSDRLGETLLP